MVWLWDLRRSAEALGVRMSEDQSESEYSIKLTFSQIAHIVEQELRISLKCAKKDYKRNPKLAGPETKTYIEAVKVVIDWWSVPEKWGKYE